MDDKVENLILEQLRVIREENAKASAETKDDIAKVKTEIADLRNMIGGQGVILTSIAGYIHQVEERVENLEGADT